MTDAQKLPVEEMQENATSTNLDTDAYSKFQAIKYFSSLDGLRALSILAVVWVHTWLASDFAGIVRTVPLLQEGVFGVDIFFLISGFIITTLLLREKRSTGYIKLKAFYLRRILRIWPLYYVVLAAYIVLVSVAEHDQQRQTVFFDNLPWYATFTYTWFGTQNNPTPIFNFAWSLSVEEQFYLFWPPALALLKRCTANCILGLSVALYLLTIALAGFHCISDRSIWFNILTSITPPLCMGAVVAQLLDSKVLFVSLFRCFGDKKAATFFAFLLFTSLATSDMLGAFYPVLPWCFAALLLTACVVREDNGLSSILSSWPLRTVGILSYCIYLVNSLAVKIIYNIHSPFHAMSPFVTFLPIVALSVLISALSYAYFESYFRKLRKKVHVS